MKILIATDGSAHSKAMVKSYAERDFLPGTEVRVITAYQASSHMLNTATMGVLNAFYKATDEEALHCAETAAKTAADMLRSNNRSLCVTTTVVEGDPKKVILAEAAKFGAELIIIGTHGRGTISKFLTGSVSDAVARHAKCSVAMVGRMPSRPIVPIELLKRYASNNSN